MPLEITEARHMTGKWLTIIIKMMMQIGPNGGILTSQLNSGVFKSRKLFTEFEVVTLMLISSRVCCHVTLCLWLRKYEEDACLRNVDGILPIDTASHHRRLASSGGWGVGVVTRPGPSVHRYCEESLGFMQTCSFLNS